MKKFLLLAFTLFSICLVHATTHIVQVSDFQFSPATLNAHVGDTIEWDWKSGTHTTTSSAIPAGAAAWDVPMTSASASFKYKLTVAGNYDYVCIPHQAFGMVASLTVTDVLPVTISGFNIVATGKNASIQWLTANEQNVAFYNIKRSTDGTNFTDISQVKAINKTGVNTYSFTDNALPESDRFIYYYLDVVDKDGAHTSSSILSFKNILAKTGLLRQIRPNPVTGTDHLMLQFYADKPGKMMTQLYNTSGALIKQAEMTAVEGINNAHFHTGALAAGTYILQCTLDGKKETRQIVVQ